jgi:hypothetical protein
MQPPSIVPFPRVFYKFHQYDDDDDDDDDVQIMYDSIDELMMMRPSYAAYSTASMYRISPLFVFKVIFA